MSDAIPDARQRLSEALWEVLQPAPLGEQAYTWLKKTRGIDGRRAYELGCRDWALVGSELAHVLRRFDMQTKIASGLYRHEDGKIQPWAPLAAILRGKTWAAGLCIPCWLPGHDAPVAWRWRYYQPRGRLKVHGQFGPTFPLGLNKAPHTSLVFIAEGEMDWLSLSEVTAHDDVAVVGITNMGAGWRRDWTPHVAQAARVLVLVHDTDKGHKLADDIFCELAAVHGVERAAKRFARMLFDEERDANDYHQSGELRAHLERHLGDVMSAQAQPTQAGVEPWPTTS